MADPPRHPDTGDDTGVAPGRGSATGTARWGKVILIIAIVLVPLFFVGLHVTGVLGPGGLGGLHS